MRGMKTASITACWKTALPIQTNAIYGHVLNLNGTNQYVWLPPGAAYGQTFVAVVNWRGGAEWQRIFDFGVNTSATVLLTPASGDNVLRCDINPGGNLQTVQWTKPLPSNVWTHVAVTLDGTQGILYVNGLPVATNTAMNLLPINVAPQTNALGQSKFTTDPYFNGQYASFRVYGRALSPQEIIAPLPEITQPANGSFYWPGDNHQLFRRRPRFRLRAARRQQFDLADRICAGRQHQRGVWSDRRLDQRHFRRYPPTPRAAGIILLS